MAILRQCNAGWRETDVCGEQIMITGPNPYSLSLSPSSIYLLRYFIEGCYATNNSHGGDTAAVANNTPACTISPRASSPTGVSCNYILPLLSASPASTRPARVICVRIRQIKKYNVRESAISSGYWTRSVAPRATSSLLAYCLRWVITSQPSASPQPLLPPKWKTGQS